MTDTTYSITKLEDARRFLAEVQQVDEAKAIRDKAEAMRVYARQAKLGLESQNFAAEIRLRAERRAGELLKEMADRGERATPGSYQGNQYDGSSRDTKTLSDLGINGTQSSNWQRIATLPEEKFEAHVADTKVAGEELTTAGVLRAASFNYKRDVKSSRSIDQYVPQGQDAWKGRINHD